MRATTDSAAMFLAPQPPEGLDKEHDPEPEPTDVQSEFAATLVLLSAPVTVPPHVSSEALGAPVTEAVTAAQASEPTPQPAGIDITMLDLFPAEQPAALPLEAALQQFTATMEHGTVAPESAPARIVTAAHEVVEVVARHIARGDQQITMVLKPAELGEVKVRVEHVRGDQVRITLEAEKPESTQLLRERVPELQAALQQQGVTVRSVDVSLQASDGMSQRGTGGEPQARQHHAEREETTHVEEALRAPKRTKRNPKDLDVLV